MNKSEQDIKLFIKHLLDIAHILMVKCKGPTDKPKARGRPRKILVTNIHIVIEFEKVIEILIKIAKKVNTNKIQVKSDPKSNKKPVKKVMSAIKISSKLHEPLTYKKVISDLIYLHH